MISIPRQSAGCKFICSRQTSWKPCVDPLNHACYPFKNGQANSSQGHKWTYFSGGLFFCGMPWSCAVLAHCYMCSQFDSGIEADSLLHLLNAWHSNHVLFFAVSAQNDVNVFQACRYGLILPFHYSEVDIQETQSGGACSAQTWRGCGYLFSSLIEGSGPLRYLLKEKFGAKNAESFWN